MSRCPVAWERLTRCQQYNWELAERQKQRDRSALLSSSSGRVQGRGQRPESSPWYLRVRVSRFKRGPVEGVGCVKERGKIGTQGWDHGPTWPWCRLIAVDARAPRVRYQCAVGVDACLDAWCPHRLCVHRPQPADRPTCARLWLPVAATGRSLLVTTQSLCQLSTHWRTRRLLRVIPSAKSHALSRRNST